MSLGSVVVLFFKTSIQELKPASKPKYITACLCPKLEGQEKVTQRCMIL